MATIKRHWRLISLAALALAVLGVLLALVLSHSPVVTADEPDAKPEKMDPVDWCRIRWLRQQIRLTNESLAAMGCSQENAEEILAAVKQWYETNKVALEQKRVAAVQAEKALRNALRKMHCQPADKALLDSIPSLKSSVSRALSQHRTLVQSLIPAVEAKLSASQKARYKAIRDNAGAFGEYRYLSDLKAEQTAALRKAHYARGLRLASAKTAAAISAVEKAYGDKVKETLTAAQLSEKTFICQTIGNCMAAVGKAEAKILPKPAELDDEQP